MDMKRKNSSNCVLNYKKDCPCGGLFYKRV